MDTSKQKDYKPLLFVVGAILLCVIGYIFWTKTRSSGTVYTVEYTPNSALEKKDSTYREAQAAARLGKYSDAASLYQDSLARATDNVQKSQIRYKIASMKDLGGAQIESIPLYKSIIADTSVTHIMRAYSVYRLGRMYVLEPRDETYASVFDANEPYHSFVVEGDRETSLKNLFEFAISLYPLALPELFSASWYADQLVASKYGKIVMTQDQKAKYLLTIRQRIELAKVDIERIIKDQNENSLVAPATAQIAYVLSQLFVIGEEKEQGVRDAYERALSMATVYNQPGEDGFTRLRYAIFLMKIKNETASDNSNKIEQLLKPLFADAYSRARIKKYLNLLPSVSKYSSEYPDVVSLAKTNTEFKMFLLGLGWDSAVFK